MLAQGLSKGAERDRMRAALALLRLPLDDQREALAEWADQAAPGAINPIGLVTISAKGSTLPASLADTSTVTRPPTVLPRPG